LRQQACVEFRQSDENLDGASDAQGSCGVALKMLDPLADVLFDTTADALSTINENIVQLRDEMNERIDELESRLDYSTKQILNKIKNQTFISGMGTELDKLHTSVTGIAGQIEVLKKDTSMSEEERAINIAAQIGSNTEWNRDGSLVFRIKTLGNVLAGRSFADMEGRDFYQIVTDNAASDVMFSGEAYDAASPYIDRVMYEYMLAYTVLADCLGAADTVSRLTDEQVEALPARAKNAYFNTVSAASLVENELNSMTDQILNAQDPDSIASRYCVFRYRKEHDRNVFVNKGTANIPIAGSLKEYKAQRSYSYDFSTCDQLLSSGKSEVQSDLDSSAINADTIKELLSYSRSRYPGITFAEFLDTVSISVPKGAEQYIPVAAKTWVNDIIESRKRTVYIGFNGFDPFSVSPSETDVSFYRWFRSGSSNFTFFPQNSRMLVFGRAENAEFPDTAEKIIEEAPEYGIAVRIAPKGRLPELAVGSVPVFLDDLFSITVTDHTGRSLSESNCSWDVMELPGSGVTLDYNGRLLFYQIRLFSRQSNIQDRNGKGRLFRLGQSQSAVPRQRCRRDRLYRSPAGRGR